MTNGEWCLQEKKDGCFYQLEKIDDDHIYLFSRTKSKKTGELAEKGANVPHIIEWAREYLPDDTVLLGEIYIPGGHSNDVTSIMGCLPKNAIARQEASDWVHYYVFDCIYYAGNNLCDNTFETRFGYYLEYMLYDCFELGNYIGGYHPACKYVEMATTYTLKENANIGVGCSSFQEKLNEIFANGGEGAVFKRLDSIYEPDKRPMTCFKMKEHVDSVDLICMELLDPVKEYTGKELETWPYWYDTKLEEEMYAAEGAIPRMIESDRFYPVTKHYFFGWKNGMRLGAYKDGKLVEVGRVASGLTDELREDMAAHPDNYIGKVVQISCMSLNKKDHTVRHPVFERMRPDKNEEDCLLNEIFN
jgi:ATP-dependent DNA ligase